MAELLRVLNHPVSDAAPDLKHFRLHPAATVRARAGGGSPGAHQAEVLQALAIGGAALAALTAAGFAWRRRPARAAPELRGGKLVLCGLLLTVATGVHGVAGPRSVTSQPVGTRVVGVPAVVPPAAAAPPQRFGADWDALVSVEAELASALDTLAQREALIRSIATAPGIDPPALDPRFGSTSGERGPGVDRLSQSQRRLAALLAAYRDASAHYREGLRREYELYRVAAQDPARRQLLVTAATINPRPEVKDAVTYNLALVQAQLAQEATIKAAETKLAAIGSLSGTQLNAIKHHQAFITPVDAPVVQGFGPTDVGFEPSVTYRGAFYPHFHTGLDLTAPENAPVHAAADGVVLLAAASQDAQGQSTGYGNYVVVAHPDGFETLYGHLNTVAVKEGDVVHQGQIVGREGSTGLSTGPHVHFEIRHDNQWVDPEPYLSGKQRT